MGLVDIIVFLIVGSIILYFLTLWSLGNSNAVISKVSHIHIIVPDLKVGLLHQCLMLACLEALGEIALVSVSIAAKD